MPTPCIAVLGTFDSKGAEHLFLRQAIADRGLRALTINVGTRSAPSFEPDVDLHARLKASAGGSNFNARDQRIAWMIAQGRQVVADCLQRGQIEGIISAGGGTGTHLCTQIMRTLPLGFPKVMVSTVASRNMAPIVGTKDITMLHSVVDILGVNSISGRILDQAAAAVCAMAQSQLRSPSAARRIALSFFGFITPAAESISRCLEQLGFEVIAFHANGTGGMAMEELAAEGFFDGILDLATHELADALHGGYCGGIGPERLLPVPGRSIPRLVVPGGLDCAVLEFTRDSIPPSFAGRQIYFYDFRSAIRLTADESDRIAAQLADKLNRAPSAVRVLNPLRGWSAADRKGEPLYAPDLNRRLMRTLRAQLDQRITVSDADVHINDPGFAELACRIMAEMLSA